jgi:hypothetical protein
MQEITAKTTSGPREGQAFTVKYDIPDSIQEALDRYPEEVVYSRFKGSLVIDLQSFMRTQIQKEDFSTANLELAVNGDGSEENPGWAPGIRAKGKSVGEKIQDMLAKLTPEQREEILAEFA